MLHCQSCGRSVNKQVFERIAAFFSTLFQLVVTTELCTSLVLYLKSDPTVDCYKGAQGFSRALLECHIFILAVNTGSAALTLSYMATGHGQALAYSLLEVCFLVCVDRWCAAYLSKQWCCFLGGISFPLSHSSLLE